jgi:heme/copper-type cytochrome/quinol oxidase subunit 2
VYIRRVIVAFLLAGLIATSAYAADRTPGGRVVEAIADKDNTFKVPGEKKPILTVKPGEQIVLRITSHFGGEQARDGAEHSFVVKKLRDQGWDIRLREGTQEYALVAPKEQGEYLIECTVKCGRGHDDMNMKLVVKNLGPR